MSISANMLKNISSYVRERSNRDIINDMIMSCLDRAAFGKCDYTNDLHCHRVSEDDIKFIVNHFHTLNFEVSSRFIEEDGYYEITVRW